MYTKKFITEGLDKNKPLIWDTETLGLYGRTRLIQVRQGDVHYEYDCFYINIEDIKYYFKDWHLVMHNAFYDLNCIDFKRWHPAKLDDTMHLARFQWPRLDSFSLANVSNFLSIGDKGEEGASDWSAYTLTKEQLEYAAQDTYLTEKIYQSIDNDLLKHPAYLLEIKSLLLSGFYSHSGMPVNTKVVRSELNKAKKELNSIKSLPTTLNINSPKQVKEFIGEDATDKASLIRSNNKYANDILEKRRITKKIQYLEDLLPYKFIFSLIKPGMAKTGRFTSSGWDNSKDYFNLQSIPRDLKGVFNMSGKGYFVCADYPALEIWLAAAVWGDPFMVSLLEQKADLHTETAKAMFRKDDISKSERQIAKYCNFNLLYGAGEASFGEILYTATQDKSISANAGKFRNQWLQIYSYIRLEHQKTFDYFRSIGSKIVYTPLGRPMLAVKPNEALNYSIQGGGAECTKLALVLLSNKGIKCVNTVHDSIALAASDIKEAEDYAKELKHAMEEAFARVTKNCKVNHLRINVDVNIGESYE